MYLFLLTPGPGGLRRHLWVSARVSAHVLCMPSGVEGLTSADSGEVCSDLAVLRCCPDGLGTGGLLVAI